MGEGPSLESRASTGKEENKEDLRLLTKEITRHKEKKGGEEEETKGGNKRGGRKGELSMFWFGRAEGRDRRRLGEREPHPLKQHFSCFELRYIKIIKIL